MNKKILLVIITMFIFSVTILAKGLKDVKTFSLIAKEVAYLNNREKTKVYKIKVKFPKKIRKEMILPSVSKGEIHIYTEDKKITYIPMLKQTIVNNLVEEENYIIKILKEFREIDFDDAKDNKIKFDDKSILVNTENSIIKEINYNNERKIVFSKYSDIGEYKFPSIIEVYEEGNLVSKTNFSEIDLNPEINDEEFVMESSYRGNKN